MIITSQKGRGRKLHILIDGEYRITTDIDFWPELGVKDGSSVSDDEWLLLVEKINYRKAINKAADFLSRRSHSVHELKVKLMRTCDEASAQKAIDRFTELGYLDDESFAKELAAYLFKNKNYSTNHVRNELFKRGVDREIIMAVVSETENDPVESIMTIISKKYADRLSDDKGRQKTVAALMRKGFLYSDIKDALYRIENEG